VCASLRFNTESREVPILVVDDPENQDRLVRAYDIGVNDSVLRPVEQQELGARVGTQLRRKFYARATIGYAQWCEWHAVYAHLI